MNLEIQDANYITISMLFYFINEILKPWAIHKKQSTEHWLNWVDPIKEMGIMMCINHFFKLQYKTSAKLALLVFVIPAAMFKGVI